MQVSRKENGHVSSSSSTAAEDKLWTELHEARELASMRHAELTALQQRAADEAAALESRAEGLRRALEAQESHTEALQKELSARPTNRQVDLSGLKLA